jgi:lipid-A-disaccharide synthase
VTHAAPIRIAIVAGEVSGDLLAAGLIRELKQRLPTAEFEGVAGPRMQRAGCVELYPMDALTVMGLEALEKVPRILDIRRALIRRYTDNPPDLFIGVDAPDFNLRLEQRLRASGIATVHYVSPTVWAWRRGRVTLIRQAVDHILTLFPFEERFYREHNVPVTFVGHPLADVIPEQYDQGAARQELGLPLDRPVVALLPGSRSSELKRHADLFVETALWLHRRHPELHFVAPFASEKTKVAFEQAIERCGAGKLPITVQMFKSREAMGAADIVLCASGTATLEAALLGKPMVVTYRTSWFTYLLIRPLMHIRLVSLPNNLAERELVPEYIQSDATVENLGKAVARLLTSPVEAGAMREALKDIHRNLRRNANARAADAVMGVLAAKTARRGNAAS